MKEAKKKRSGSRTGSVVRTNKAKKSALGFRVHSGWAALVVLAGTPRAPSVTDRRRIEIADPAIPGSKQPYHAAEGRPLAKAEAYLNRCIARTKLLARLAVSAVVADLRTKGHELAGGGILTAAGRPLPTLQQTLSSHALIHTAEGELFRNALFEACEHCKLTVAKVGERELFARGAAALGIPAEELRERVSQLGRSLGPPWTQDEKHAALAAWIVLSAASRRARRPSRPTV